MSSLAVVNDLRHFVTIAPANSLDPSLGRTTTSSTLSQRTLLRVKTLGRRLQFWKSSSRRETADESDEVDEVEDNERRTWRQQALEHLAAFDNPNPFAGVPGMLCNTSLPLG